MRVVFITRGDGGLSVMQILDDNVDPAAEVGRWERATGHTAVSWAEGALADIPANRTFRGAWCCGAHGIGVDMLKARAIHMERIRAVRNARLAALDIETMKALGRGDDTRRAAVEAGKQRLRDIPQRLDLEAAKTPDALEAIWPEELA